MRPTRRQVLAATVSTIAIAGCAAEGDETDTQDAGSDGDGDTPTASPTATPTASPTQTETMVEAEDETETATSTETETGPTVQVRSHSEYGDILVDSEGMTLYMFDSDTQGEAASTCYDGCAEAWPPLTVEDEPNAGDNVTAELMTFERDDGSMQVSANGWPLYFFQNDEEPGDVVGQGVNDVWWVLDPAGQPLWEEAAATETPTQTPTLTDTPDDGDDNNDGSGYY